MAVITLQIDYNLCDACGKCDKVCATRALVLNKATGRLVFKRHKCAGCAACVDVCEKGALSFE